MSQIKLLTLAKVGRYSDTYHWLARRELFREEGGQAKKTEREKENQASRQGDGK